MANGMRELMNDVAEFHRVMGVPVAEKPQELDTERLKLRLRLDAEEFCELLDACGCPEEAVKAAKATLEFAISCADEYGQDLTDIADARIDMAYVNAGALLEHGIPGDRVWAEVHRSNMAKGYRREDGKETKPPGWQPPDIRKAVFGG